MRSKRVTHIFRKEFNVEKDQRQNKKMYPLVDERRHQSKFDSIKEATNQRIVGQERIKWRKTVRVSKNG